MISVFNKEGIVELAGQLATLGWELVSTGGTAELLAARGIQVTAVSKVTGFPEILDGRVKTLHPAIHAGILARSTEEHQRQIAEFGIDPIDLVVVNLYPFAQTISRPGVSVEEATENIDIGGPALLRAAAKNWERVTVVVNPKRYQQVLEQLCSGQTTLDLRQRLAAEAFAHTACYDALVANYLEWLPVAGSKGNGSKERGRIPAFPEKFVLAGEMLQELRYGENPHQEAAFYREAGPAAQNPGALVGASQLLGKELSFNNIMDLEAAWSLVKGFDSPAAVIIKHNNPCGAAQAEKPAEAYRKAFAADPVSAFGGVVALNRPLDRETAGELAKTFLEAVVCPACTVEAREVLSAKEALRLLVIDLSATEPADGTGYIVAQGGPGNEESQDGPEFTRPIFDVKKVSGGFLVQEADITVDPPPSHWSTVTRRAPSAGELADLEFAWKVVRHVKSNAIVVAKGGVTLGVGAGQMNRVGAARLALEQAGEAARGAVLASDAFLPFSDTVQLTAAAGITAIVQPGGSMRDKESIEEADRHALAMVFTGRRHFKH